MRIAFFGDSLTAGTPGVSYLRIIVERNARHSLVNYGRGGDSVISLYRRMLRMPDGFDADLAFVWIGTNDVFPRVSWTFPCLRGLLRQPWARDVATFETFYRRILDWLSPRARRVVVVAPLMVGERIDNPWNPQIRGLADCISSLAVEYPGVEFLDLRDRFGGDGRSSSDYVASSAVGVARDVLFARTPRDVDRIAHDRGLVFTLDGVHLNSAGAAAVADAFEEVIVRAEGEAVPSERVGAGR
jgi:lysophospholipase L1-like esterase